MRRLYILFLMSLWLPLLAAQNASDPAEVPASQEPALAADAADSMLVRAAAA